MFCGAGFADADGVIEAGVVGEEFGDAEGSGIGEEDGDQDEEKAHT
jgi:hypothetical protein